MIPERYERQTLLPEIGEDGQVRLQQSRVLIVGAGGLGSPVALYLAAAGVGTIGIIDDDVVSLSNLNRQILHSTPEVGTPKVQSARGTIFRLNPEVRVLGLPKRLTSEYASKILGGKWDVVIDACDNAETRYILNDACVATKTPMVHGSVSGFEGQVTTFKPGEGPCYRCLYPEPPPESSRKPGGVLGVVPGVIGTLQATEVLKILLGLGETLVGTLLWFDSKTSSFQKLGLTRNPLCTACRSTT